MKITSLFFVLISFFICSCGKSTPSYVMPIGIREILNAEHKSWNWWQGNTFLIDKDYGLFVTNAHIAGDEGVIKGEERACGIKILGKWYKGEVHKEWVNWEADLAIVRINPTKVKKFPKAASLVDPPSIGSSVTIKGYQGNATDNEEYPYRIKCSIANIDAHCDDISDKLLPHLMFQRSALQALREEGENVPKEDLKFIYPYYIILTEAKNRPKFERGISGSPVISKNGNVVGIISWGGFSGGYFLAFAQPAAEIKTLLEKVKKDIDSRK